MLTHKENWLKNNHVCSFVCPGRREYQALFDDSSINVVLWDFDRFFFLSNFCDMELKRTLWELMLNSNSSELIDFLRTESFTDLVKLAW